MTHTNAFLLATMAQSPREVQVDFLRNLVGKVSDERLKELSSRLAAGVLEEALGQ